MECLKCKHKSKVCHFKANLIEYGEAEIIDGGATTHNEVFNQDIIEVTYYCEKCEETLDL